MRTISKYKPPGGAYIWRGDLTEAFSPYELGGLIFGGACFRILRYDDYSPIKEGDRSLRYKSFCCIMKSFRCKAFVVSLHHEIEFPS